MLARDKKGDLRIADLLFSCERASREDAYRELANQKPNGTGAPHSRPKMNPVGAF